MWFKSFLILTLTLTFNLNVVTSSNINSNNARSYLTDVSRKLFRLYEEIHRLTFERHQYDYLSELDIIGRTIDEIANITMQTHSFNVHEIDDAEIKIALKNLERSAYLYILGGDKFNQISVILDQMMSPATQKNICDYKSHMHCNLAYIPDIVNMIKGNTYSPDCLLYYWKEWRAGAELISRPLFPEFLKLFKLAAEKTGVDPVEFLFNFYNGDTTIADNMKQVIDELMPFYKELHGYVRHELNAKYGDSIISKTQPLPDHLYQTVVLQAWKKKSILDQPYPNEKLPNLKAGLEKEHINIQGMLEVSENYFVSMGFTKLPRKIKSNLKRKHENELGSECKADIYDRTPNIRMEFCPHVNIKRFLQMHGYFSRIHYAYEKRDLPFYYFNSYKFEDAVGEAIILSASTPDHLKNIGIVSDFAYTPEVEMNRLFRMGVHTLFNVPVFYVHVRFLQDILSGHIDMNQINVHYWNLMEKYVGVEPPIDRNIGAFDLAYKFFFDLKENRLVSKFVSEILGYQIYESLCTLTGKFSENLPLRKDLHDCNLEGHPEVGDALTKMMKLGSKKPWRETLSEITGNINGLSAKGLLNYYAPLREWLQNQIRIKNINIGWGPSKRVLNLNYPRPL